MRFNFWSNIKNMMLFRLITMMLFLTLAGHLYANNILHKADSLYLKKEYSSALYRYKQIIREDRFLKDDFNLNFKLGICYYSNGDYQKAYNCFLDLKSNHASLAEYVDYYVFLSAVKAKSVSHIINLSNKYLRSYSKHYLADSLRLHLANYQFDTGNYHAASNHYSILSRKRKFKKLKPYLSKKVALCKYNLGRYKESEKQMYQIIKKYPGSSDALEIANFMSKDPEVAKKYFFTIADVYLKHNYLTMVRAKLEIFTRSATDPNLKEKARYYLLKLYYQKGEYKTALYGLKNLHKSLRNNLLEPRIKLMIARCYLRLEMNNDAALTYVEYAEQYPRRRIADDAIWKAAWIYEEQGSIKKALEMYNKMISLWPRGAYSKESKFRKGLSYYRLGWHANAEQIFSDISEGRLSLFHKHRGLFWLAKTYQASGKNIEADNIYILLGSQVFESYYATKSYLMYQDEVDSLYHINRFLDQYSNPLLEHRQSQAVLIDHFKDVFLIDDLLGKEYAFKELAITKNRPANLEDWVSLAEIYKRLEAYNKAYQIYDHIDKVYFGELLTYEKPFLLKEAYPLYYDNLVSLYTNVRQLDQNLVLAIIRAESGYDSNAHSWADAYGLMQLIPRTANEIARELALNLDIPDILFDPETNINLGTYYLNKLLHRFDNRVTYALAAYNAGPHRVDKWQNISQIGEDDLFVENIEFSQTRNYVRKVLRNYWVYEILSHTN